ncbi:MAG: hypothetical protein I3275_04060 [Candidatus Moeniiplasma glomeromycotorum]|nr:hypothetical protein [Candidatus Moeniiplasma glomeromycotorum]
MSNIDKNLSNKRKKEEDSSDWLLYIFYFLFAVLIGLIIWWVYDKYFKENPPTHARVVNYEGVLGKKEENPQAKAVSDLIRNNRETLKSVNWLLEGKVKGKELSEAEKENAREKLKGVNKKLVETLQSFKISEIPPENLKTIYDQLYEEAKILLEVYWDLSASPDSEETKKQWEVQQEWDISEAEHTKIKQKLDVWLTKWYNEGIEKILPKKNLTILTEVIKPVVYNEKGEPKEISAFPNERVLASLKKEWVYKDGVAFDLTKPLKNEFVGYNGFVDEENEKKSSEGSAVMGLTVPLNSTAIIPNIENAPSTLYHARIFWKNHQKQAIRLKKELFFNRLGYDWWITKLGKEDKNNDKFANASRLDINFQQVVDTIAHELAHVLVNLTNFDYQGEEGGGHGKLFYEVMEEVEKMMRDSSEFIEFEGWWKENWPK